MVSRLVDIAFVNEEGETIASKTARSPNIPEEMEEGGPFPFIMDLGRFYQPGMNIQINGDPYVVKTFLEGMKTEQAIYVDPR